MGGDFYQYPRKQAGRIPISVLIVWGAIVLYSSRNLTARLFARPSAVAVEAGLRWGDRLNTAPPATVLMREGLIGFAEKTKTTGKSEGRPWVGSHYAFSKKAWIRTVYEMCRNYSCEFNRDFWIGQPLMYESEFRTFNHSSEFWHCSDKMMTYLLGIAGHPEGQ